MPEPSLDLKNGVVPDPLTVIVDISADWHIGDGYGVPGGVDATVRRDTEGRPYLPGTTLTGLWRDACARASIALDAEAVRAGATGRPWWAWVRALFGHAGAMPLFTVGPALLPPGAQPRALGPSIPGAISGDDPWTLVKPGVRIDRATGRAAEDMLRFVEMARPATLFTTARLGNAGSWTPVQRRAAMALLLIGASMVESVGGDRRRGAGTTQLLISKSPSVTVADAGQADGERQKAFKTRGKLLESAFTAITRFRSQVPGVPKVSATPSPARTPVVVARATATGWMEVDLTIALRRPLLASTGVSGNMLTSADRLPGTVLLPWVHGALCALAPDAAADAVTSGELIVTAATPEIAGQQGRPVPLSFQKKKTTEGREKSAGGDEPPKVLNRLRSGAGTAQYKPMRAGYVACAPDPDDPDTGTARLFFHRPVLGVAMHNQVAEGSQRPTEESGIYTVQMIPSVTRGRDRLPTPTRLRACVRVSSRLHDALAKASAKAGSDDWPGRCLAGQDVRLGGKSKSEYGLVRVEVAGVRECTPRDGIIPFLTPCTRPDGGNGNRGELYVWLLSDTIVRDSRLRMSADAVHLVEKLRALGVGVKDLPVIEPGRDGPVSASVRTRRIDSWHRPSGLPRPTLTALAAGTCLRLCWDGSGADVLARLEITGIGERTAEGFGQVRFNDPTLTAAKIELPDAKDRAPDPAPGEGPVDGKATGPVAAGAITENPA